MNFTFKTTPATGRYRSFQSDCHEIKYNKRACGVITDSFPYKVRFQLLKVGVENSKNPNCSWEWVTVKTPEFNDVREAKQWIRSQTQAILNFVSSKGTSLYFE